MRSAETGGSVRVLGQREAADAAPGQGGDQVLGVRERDWPPGSETQYRALTWAMPTSEMASSFDCSGGRAVSSAITSAMMSAIS